MMNKLVVSLLAFIITLNTNAQTEDSKYNKALADSLEADAYGMKMYVLVILKQGVNLINNKVKEDSLFMNHLQNIGHLAKIGKLVAAGPLKQNKNSYQGIFILNARTIEEAKLLLDSDSAIKAKLLDIELYQWYGSAALPLYLKFHDRIKKKNF